MERNPLLAFCLECGIAKYPQLWVKEWKAKIVSNSGITCFCQFVSSRRSSYRYKYLFLDCFPLLHRLNGRGDSPYSLMKNKTQSYPRHNFRQRHTKSSHLTHPPIPFQRPAVHCTLFNHSFLSITATNSLNTLMMLLTTFSLLPRVHHRSSHTNHNPYDSSVQAPLRCSTKIPSISVIMSVSPFPSISSTSDTTSLSSPQQQTLHH